jgi:hypothetical protein
LEEEMNNTIKWIIGGFIFFTLIGLSFYSGRKSVKIPNQIHLIDTVYYSKTDTITRTIHKVIKAKPDTVYIDSVNSYLVYTEVVDTLITFKSDSLDFVAEITFNDSSKSFYNLFDFNLRVKKVIEEIIKEVPYYMPPEIWETPLVIIMGLVIAFLSGLAL